MNTSTIAAVIMAALNMVMENTGNIILTVITRHAITTGTTMITTGITRMGCDLISKIRR